MRGGADPVTSDAFTHVYTLLLRPDSWGASWALASAASWLDPADLGDRSS